MLATLLDGPKHGYQLKREAGFIFGHGDLHNNLVYPMLRRFTAEGWVTRKTVPGERGQTRRQYTLTAAGKKQLIERLLAYDKDEVASQPAFITRVGMFELLQKAERTHILDEREGHLRSRAEKLTTLQRHMHLGLYANEVIKYLAEQIRSELSWIVSLHRLGATRHHGGSDSPARKV
jgi:DNA-binding PadR family transcriptional regulator